jgi:methyltransferase-like protein/SAM-dependent methyltransferase
MEQRSVPEGDRAALDLIEYDRFRYDNFPFRATHPDWLRTASTLLGMSPAPAESCRVLELGCGRGGNLVGLATALPGSTFLGIDHAPSQVADGTADAAALGLTNVEFRSLDIRDLDERVGGFDYVICHGVFSWVPDDVRDQILSLTESLLLPGGVGFISFNTRPGWAARGIVRDMLRRWVPDGPAEEMAAAARSILGLWREASSSSGPLAGFVDHETELLGRLSDHYLYFEHLVEHNHPYLLTEFVQLLDGTGLAYLGDADIASMSPAQLGDEAQAQVEALGLDPVATEQLLDDLTIRFFRRALVCRADDLPERSQNHSRLESCWVASDMTIDELSVDLDNADGGRIDIVLSDADGAVLRPDDPHTAALLWVLAEHRPRGLAVRDLALEVASRLGVSPDETFIDETIEIAHALVMRGRLDAGVLERPLAADVMELPLTTELVRYQARCGRRIVTTGRHEHFATDRMDMVLLRNLDGAHDRSALLGEVAAAQTSGELEVTIDDVEVSDPEILDELIGTKLDRYVLAGLLVDPLLIDTGPDVPT